MALRDTISKKCKKILGGGIKSVRHSFDAPANQFLRLSDAEQVELLGHKGKKGVIKHYQTEQQLKTDLLHIGVIDSIGICEIVKHFYEVGYKRGFIPYQLSLGAIKMLGREKLVSFGIEDELGLQQLTKQWKENPTVAVDEEGVLIQTESEKPEELKELESQKELHYHLSLPSLDLNLNDARKDEAWFCFIEELVPFA